MATPILELKNLQKHFRSYWTYSRIQAVQDVSLKIESGESFGFLGHNGAGKTTTIKCISGLIHPTGGEILLNGAMLQRPEQRKIIGYLPEHPYFYDHLRVDETLGFFAGLAGINGSDRSKRVSQTLEEVGLCDRAKAPVRTLSKGLQQRLGLAQAIIHRPSLLLLDEPFSGLDPIGRVEVRELVLSLREQGTTIFISSHILSDVQDICDRVSIMANGKLCNVFDLNDTAKLFGERYLIKTNISAKNLVTDADSITQRQTTGSVTIQAEYAQRSTADAALKRIVTAGESVLSFSHKAPSLEEVFVQTTKEAKPNSQPLPSEEKRVSENAEDKPNPSVEAS